MEQGVLVSISFILSSWVTFVKRAHHMMAVFVVIVCKMSLCTYRQVDRLIAQVHTKVRTIAVVDDEHHRTLRSDD
jgi:hypothetical protein